MNEDITIGQLLEKIESAYLCLLSVSRDDRKLNDTEKTTIEDIVGMPVKDWASSTSHLAFGEYEGLQIYSSKHQGIEFSLEDNAVIFPHSDIQFHFTYTILEGYLLPEAYIAINELVPEELFAAEYVQQMLKSQGDIDKKTRKKIGDKCTQAMNSVIKQQYEGIMKLDEIPAEFIVHVEYTLMPNAPIISNVGYRPMLSKYTPTTLMFPLSKITDVFDDLKDKIQLAHLHYRVPTIEELLRNG